MNLLHCIKECYDRKQKMDKLDKNNPFKDVRFVSKETEDTVTITISLDASEKLDNTAVQKVLAEMLSKVLIEDNLVEFNETTTTEEPGVLYTGSVTVEKLGQ